MKREIDSTGELFYGTDTNQLLGVDFFYDDIGQRWATYGRTGPLQLSPPWARSASLLASFQSLLQAIMSASKFYIPSIEGDTMQIISSIPRL